MTGCPVYAGPDRCHLDHGHTGDHRTLWGKPGDTIRPVMTWNGNEPWSHNRNTA